MSPWSDRRQEIRFLERLFLYPCCVIISCFSYVWFYSPPVSLSMGFSRQEYRGGLLCPPAEDLPHPETEPISLVSSALSGRFFTTSATREAHFYTLTHKTMDWWKRTVFLCHGKSKMGVSDEYVLLLKVTQVPRSPWNLVYPALEFWILWFQPRKGGRDNT